MGLGRWATDKAKDANAWWSLAARVVAVLALSGVTGWFMKLLHGPPWMVLLSVICAADVAAILLFWVSLLVIYRNNLALNSAEIAADKQRKREFVERWRTMAVHAVNDPRAGRIKISEILLSYSDYLSLRPHLSANMIGCLGCDPDPSDVHPAFDKMSLEISGIAKKWGIE